MKASLKVVKQNSGVLSALSPLSYVGYHASGKLGSVYGFGKEGGPLEGLEDCSHGEKAAMGASQEYYFLQPMDKRYDIV